MRFPVVYNATKEGDLEVKGIVPEEERSPCGIEQVSAVVSVGCMRVRLML